MGCGCNKAKAGKTTYEVVAQNGKVVFDSTSEATAKAVGQRYPGSEVRPAAPATVAAKVVTTPAKT